MSWQWKLGSRGPGRCRPALTSDCGPKTPQWSWKNLLKLHSSLWCFHTTFLPTSSLGCDLHVELMLSQPFLILSIFSHTGVFPSEVLACSNPLWHLLPVETRLKHRGQSRAEISQNHLLCWQNKNYIVLRSQVQTLRDNNSAAKTVHCHLRSEGTKVFLLKRRIGHFK